MKVETLKQKNIKFRKFLRTLSVCSAIMEAGSLAFISNAQATENGTTHYPIDIGTTYAGFTTNPGTWVLDVYTQYYNGTSHAGPDGKNNIPGFDTSTVVVAPRILYKFPQQIFAFGPFTSHATVGLITPFINLNVNMFGEHGHKVGLADIALEMDLSLDSPQNRYFSYFGVDTFFPTGSYKKTNLANTGYNYYTVQPNYALTWFPTWHMQFNNTTEMTFNTTNNSSAYGGDYHSGTEIENDSSLLYSPMPMRAPNFWFGIQGYVQKQIQDDTLNGVSFENGNKAQGYGIGPQFVVSMFHNRGGIVLKYTHQFGVRNEARGNQIWFEFAVPLS